MSTKRTRTPEELKQANLKRFYRRMKTEVADREELWLEMFMQFVGMCLKDDVALAETHITMASMLADRALREYEERWG